MKKLLIFMMSGICLGFFAFLLFGCAQQGIQPKDWYNFDQLKTSMKNDSFRKPIDDAVAQKDYVEAARQRNIAIAKVVSGINAAWSDSRDKILVGNATINTAVDITQIAVSTLGSYLTNADVLRRLAMSSTILGGSKTAFDKNFLQGQGIILLVEKMEALRTAQLEKIQEKYSKDYSIWPFDTAMDACAKLFDSGTVTGALLAINQKN